MNVSIGDLEKGQAGSGMLRGNKFSDSPSLISRLCRKQVLGLLAKMSYGRLSMCLPDGRVIVFGSGESPDSIAGKHLFEADIKVNSDEFFVNVLKFGDIGLAESYIDGLCETSSLRALISWFLLNVENSPVLNESQVQSKLFNLFSVFNRLIHLKRSNNVGNSKANIRAHYDLGNDFFKLFLDKSMTYSSALFDEQMSMDLYAAQNSKYSRLCKQLRLRPEDHLLEIGCGWGSFALYAASTYGCRVTGVTISEEQYKYAVDQVRRNKLEHLIELKLCDYRRLEGKFSKIASIEMIEAVGDEHMDGFIAVCDRLLARQGLLALQMIISPDSRYETLKKNVDFIQKHIFPGSLLPSLRRINQSMERAGELFLFDYFDMGTSYVETLRRWQVEFNKNLESIRALGFDDSFIAKWNYYFEYCQAAFDMRNVSVVQAVFTRPNNLSLRG